VVHADRLVARGDQAGERREVEPELALARRQRRRVDPLLVGPDPGDVGEGVERQPVGAQLEQTIEIRVEARLGLQRQTVDQVEVDPFVKADLARRQDELARLLEGLPPADRLLHLGGEVLDPHRQPVEAEARQRLELRARGHPRIDLDRHLGVGERA
jgi:hypothetical protein